MGENDSSADSQATTRVTDIGYVPATVHGHTKDREGLVLHTRGDSNDTDIRVFPDDRDPQRLGDIGA